MYLFLDIKNKKLLRSMPHHTTTVYPVTSISNYNFRLVMILKMQDNPVCFLTVVSKMLDLLQSAVAPPRGQPAQSGLLP